METTRVVSELGAGFELAAEEGLLVQAPALVQGCESDEAGETTSEPEAPVPGVPAARPRRRAVAVGSAVSLALLVACALVVGSHSRTRFGDAASAVGLSEADPITGVLESLASGLKKVDGIAKEVNDTYSSVSKLADVVNETSDAFVKSMVTSAHKAYGVLSAPSKWREMLKKKLSKMNETEKAAIKQKIKERLNIDSWKDVRPKANLTDGNVCPDDEEFSGGLCYEKCSALTGGKYPYRVSAYSCCSHKPPCGPPSLSTQPGTCSGYAVSSHSMNRCPHTKGSCLLNEELFDGFCYKQCLIITYSKLPSRTGPSTCCEEDKSGNRLAFLDATGCDTDPVTYSIGGGAGFSAEEPVEVHQPIPSLTET